MKYRGAADSDAARPPRPRGTAYGRHGRPAQEGPVLVRPAAGRHPASRLPSVRPTSPPQPGPPCLRDTSQLPAAPAL
eukprot:SAG11_NODE_27763_length_329_cov_0.878261_1_plen_76_part_01